MTIGIKRKTSSLPQRLLYQSQSLEYVRGPAPVSDRPGLRIEN